MNPADPLAQLRDIHLPEPVSWWPPAPGWWLVALIILAVIITLVYFLRRRFLKNKYRKVALNKLSLLESHNKDNALGTLEEISAILRRVAMQTYGRQSVAPLAGDSWLEFLDKTGKTSITMRGDTSATGQSLTLELGIKVRNLEPGEGVSLGLAPKTSAVLITEMDPKMPAAKRLRKNDLILGINYSPVHNVDELYQLLGSLPPKQQSVMTLARDGTLFYAVLNPG